MVTWQEDFISLFALDMPISDILGRINKNSGDILNERIKNPDFDRQCDVALKSHKAILLSEISRIEKEMLKGAYAFGSASMPNSVIKSLQWRLGYIGEFEEVVAVRAAPSDGGGFRVELIEQLEAV